MLRTAVTCDGTFDVSPVQWEGLDNHCGIDAATVRYKVTVCGNLDERGFVLDVRDPRDYFSRVYTEGRAPLVSCETIAQRAVDYFRSIAHNPVMVTVEIQGAVYGFASAYWTSEEN